MWFKWAGLQANIRFEKPIWLVSERIVYLMARGSCRSPSTRKRWRNFTQFFCSLEGIYKPPAFFHVISEWIYSAWHDPKWLTLFLQKSKASCFTPLWENHVFFRDQSEPRRRVSHKIHRERQTCVEQKSSKGNKHEIFGSDSKSRSQEKTVFHCH